MITNPRLQTYKEKFELLLSEIHKDEVEVEQSRKELDWQDEHLGFVIDEAYSDEVYMELYALSEIKIIVSWAYEHINKTLKEH